MAETRVFTHDELKIVEAWLEQRYANIHSATPEDERRIERVIRMMLYEVDDQLGADHNRAYVR